MKKGKRRVAALFLSLCMVLSLVTVVPVKADSNQVTLGSNNVDIDDDIENGSLVVFNSLNWNWSAAAGKDLITGIDTRDPGHSGTEIWPGEERKCFFAILELYIEVNMPTINTGKRSAV